MYKIKKKKNNNSILLTRHEKAEQNDQFLVVKRCHLFVVRSDTCNIRAIIV